MTATTATTAPPRGGVRRPGAPSSAGGYVHGGVVLVLLLAVAALALVVTPPAPPGIAEFAPRANETVDEALKQQASQFGQGDGGDCGAGQDCAAGGGTGVTTTTTTPTPPGAVPPKRVIEQARVKHCIGDPPRQTEDPQSPPCANYWDGDNGGATSKGVTGDEIRVAYPLESGSNVVETYIQYFNKRFQFYGRQLRGVPVQVMSDRQAYAVAADEEAHAFAALDYMQDIQGTVSGEPFFRELARREVIGVAGVTRRFTDNEIADLSPYFWQYEPSIEFLERQAAALVCRLRGATASHAGPELRTKPRKFAVLYDQFADGTKPPMKALDDGLAACGEKAQKYVINDATVNGRTGRGNDMRTAGVTSVVVLASPSTFTGDMQGYSQVSYEPELLVSGYSLPQHEGQMQSFGGDASTRSHLFGVGQFNRLNPQADEPAVWAAREAAPEDDSVRGRAQGHNFYSWYYALLLLSSGIQQAGPHLTPTTFAEGLEKTKFPNPGAGQAPYYQAHVGFGPSDHTMVDDVTSIWWNGTAPAYRSNTNPTGGWCYVDHGARHAALSWPADLDGKLFDPASCR